MSEPSPPRSGSQNAKGGFLTRKSAGIPNWGWIGGAALAGTGLFLWWRNRKAGQAAAAAGGAPQGNCTDASGNPVDCASVAATGSAGGSGSSSDQIAAALTGIEGSQQAILAAIKDLQGPASTNPPGGGTGDGGGSTGGSGGDPHGPPVHVPPPGPPGRNHPPPRRRRRRRPGDTHGPPVTLPPRRPPPWNPGPPVWQPPPQIRPVPIQRA